MMRWTLRIAVGALAAALVCGAAEPTSPGQASYQKANALFVAQKFNESLAAVEEALRLDPNLVAALTLHAKLAMAANRYDVARKSLEHALKVDPKEAYAQFLYGMEAWMNNDVQAALPRFRKARELAPRDARAALYLGLATESLGQPADALVLYQEAIRLERAAGQPQSETLLPGSRSRRRCCRAPDCWCCSDVWRSRSAGSAKQSSCRRNSATLISNLRGFC